MRQRGLRPVTGACRAGPVAEVAGAPAGGAQRKALVVATQHWESPFRVGSHHVAAALRDHGYAVLYVSAPLTPLHWLRFSDHADRRARARAVWQPLSTGGVQGFVPFALLAPDRRPLLRAASVVRHWWRLAVPPLRRMLARQGFDDVELLYCDNPYQSFWPGLVRHRRFVFRVPDDLAGFHGGGQAVVAEQKRLAEAADRVIFAGHELRRRFAHVGDERALVIPNGVATEAFARRQSLPAAHRGLRRPIAIYVGALDDWFDAALLREVARLRPEVTFVVVGPEGAGAARLGHAKNLVRLGALPFEDVVGLLQHADVGLIPFDVRRHGRLIDAVHPLKLYEYMAAGLPVVSVRWAELMHVRPPVVLVDQEASAFAAGIDRALRDGVPAAAYRRFLSGASWSERLRPLFRYLDGESA